MRGNCAAGGLVVLIATVSTRVAAADAPVQPAPPTLAPLTPPPVTFPALRVLPPLWPDEDLPPRPPRPKHHDTPLMIAGIVITSLGLATSAVGAAMCSDPNDLGWGLILMLPVGMMALPGLGIPMWVAGARSWHTWDPPDASSRLPTLTAAAPGARSAMLGWAF